MSTSPWIFLFYRLNSSHYASISSLLTKFAKTVGSIIVAWRSWDRAIPRGHARLWTLNSSQKQASIQWNEPPWP
jgi:hypothetical protein